MGARKNFLFNQYCASHSLISLEVLSFVEESIVEGIKKLEKKKEKERENEEEAKAKANIKDAFEADAKVLLLIFCKKILLN